jgi:hypothetical protein
VLDYLGEIEADFLAIYQIFEFRDDERLTGPKFIRLATQLPRYDGAVRRRLEMEAQSEGSGDSTDQGQYADQPASGQTMSMKEALARGQGNPDGVLHAINQEHANSQYGALFEYEVG